MTTDLSIVFSGGGTLGHLFAGLAVAEVLREIEPAVRIRFAGTGASRERQHVTQAGFGYDAIPCRPWPRRPWSAGHFLIDNFRGFLSGRRLLNEARAALVVGLGGYASAPVARAALSLHVPLVLLEQNAVPGRVNRWLSPQARCVCTAFEPHPALRAAIIYHTGNPVRRAFIRQRSAPAEKLLLITGGSLGSSALNTAVPEALANLKPLLHGWRVVHQAGEREADATRDRYRRLGLTAEVSPFVDMTSLLPRAGLAVCRAGGSTIAELLVSGTPAILCPYPHAADDHQRQNAAALGDACQVVEQESPAFCERLSRKLAVLLSSNALRAEMSRAMLRQSRPDASQRVAELILRSAKLPGMRRLPLSPSQTRGFPFFARPAKSSKSLPLRLPKKIGARVYL